MSAGETNKKNRKAIAVMILSPSEKSSLFSAEPVS
jgi:hypothetical protein